MSNITVSLPDGSERELPEGATALDLAESIGKRLAKAAVAAVVDGTETDLTRPLPDGSTVAIITDDSPDGRHVLRHSTSHVMAQAVTRLFPGAKFSIGPAIENGFYYDFELPGGKTFSDDDLEAVEAEMRQIIAENQPFERIEMSMDEGVALFADQPYKVDLINRFREAATDSDEAYEIAGGIVSAYRNSPEFVDMCVGPHVPSTGKLGHFRLQKVAGAYWRGDEKNPMLQRIYGTAWESKKALVEHLHQLEEAAKRDHRKLATELDLLSLPERARRRSGGVAPEGRHRPQAHGGLQPGAPRQGGYEFVYTPHLANGEPVQDLGPPRFLCRRHVPADGNGQRHVLHEADELPDALPDLPVRQLKSYRELPLRLFELGTCTATSAPAPCTGSCASGASPRTTATSSAPRSRRATRCAACSTSWSACCGRSGSTTSRRSTWPPGPGEVGGHRRGVGRGHAVPEVRRWRHGLPFTVDEGARRSTVPKIDVKVRDAIGRKWQLSTIQYDFNLPERFDLTYVGRTTPASGRS
jgi:threonyl-tRNA synthetase